MHTAKSLKDKKNHIIFLYIKHKKIQKYVLACILALITSLLETWELGQYLKNSKKIFCFLLVFGITNLYVRIYT